MKHVETGADTALAQRGQQRVAIDQRAARRVDQHRARLHQRQSPGIEHPARIGADAEVQAHHVGLAQQVVELADPLRAGLGRAAAIGAETPGQHLHAQRLARHGGTPADRAQADNAQRRPARAADVVGRPVPRAQGTVHLGNAAQAAEHQRDGVLGDLVRVVATQMGDGDALQAARLQVDPVNPRAGARDQLQLRQRGQHLGGELCAAIGVIDDLGIGAAPDQIGGVQRAGIEDGDLAQRPQSRFRRRAAQIDGVVVGHHDADGHPRLSLLSNGLSPWRTISRIGVAGRSKSSRSPLIR